MIIKSSRPWLLAMTAAPALLVFATPGFAQTPKSSVKPEMKAEAKPEVKSEAKADAKAEAKADAKADPKIERGRYIAEEVARCQECHTPKLESGEFDKTKWMKGATLPGIPATPIPDWHQKAPDITSTSRLWERWKVEGFVKFLQTAKNPRGGTAGPPMPAYTLKAEDAEALTAYLKSLP